MTVSSEIPTEMRAVEIVAAGGPEVLKPCICPLPEIKAGEILIKVAAAGVNRPDCLQRAGLYPAPKDASDLPGLEVAGRVVAMGENVDQWQIGDQVCALTPGGGYGEYCKAPAGHALPWPEDHDAVKSAALPETFFTVWTNVFDRARLQAGETLLVHGGSSGIGTTAIQLAKAFGASIIITAGSDEKCDFCKQLGADHSINYKTRDWEAEVKAITDGKGVDVVLDMVGAPYMQKNLNCLAVEGRYALLAFLQGPKAKLDLTRVLTDRLTISGSTLRPQSINAKNLIADRLYNRVWPLLDAGKIKPIIHATFPFEKAELAHRLMESSKHMGKIILTF